MYQEGPTTRRSPCLSLAKKPPLEWSCLPRRAAPSCWTCKAKERRACTTNSLRLPSPRALARSKPSFSLMEIIQRRVFKKGRKAIYLLARPVCSFRVGTRVIYASWIKCSRLENESFDLVQHYSSVITRHREAFVRIYETCVCAQVSLMTRIVPSPDWFIGVDGFDLCNDGKWIDTVTLEASQIITVVDHYARMFQLCTREQADQPQCIILARELIWKYNHSHVQIGFKKNSNFHAQWKSGYRRLTPNVFYYIINFSLVDWFLRISWRRRV